MASGMMRPAQLAQTAVAAFEEVMAAQDRPRSMIRHVADTAHARAEEALAQVPEAPARDAFGVAFNEVSGHVRTLLCDTGHLPETVTKIRDEAHKLAYQVDGTGEAWHSEFVQAARKLVQNGPDGPGRAGRVTPDVRVESAQTRRPHHADRDSRT
ncbi:hypothetical protein [Actinomadura macra]|uniref:hypothetical protein n=1 Tax=Actinomadura macra TaxID=46164 RepID=UPI0008302107|nr:hypothetical protein [Actinomadura macra]